MENLEKGQITENELIEKLVKAKKVMNKVDSGDFSKNNLDQEKVKELFETQEEIEFPSVDNNEEADKPKITLEEKIRKTKLPDEIKQVMLKTPPANFEPNMNESFISKAKKLMEKEIPQKKQPTTGLDESLKKLLPAIKKIINDSLDEKLEKYLTKEKEKSINENIQIKVGKSIFSGKITSIKQ